MKIRKNQSLGFTLIELLIVIALLGALAVGLLASIDPFEQLKKGTDTSVRNMVSEVYNSAIRYYAAKNGFPWGTDLTAAAMSGNNFTDSTTGYITQIVGAGELKAGFAQLAGSGNLAKIKVTSIASGGTRSTVAVCYQPDSKSFQNDANTKFQSDGNLWTAATACKSQTSANGTDCYWCVQ
jgi:prepilin-type N-terminal cleavage/methylation domain-containing protein